MVSAAHYLRDHLLAVITAIDIKVCYPEPFLVTSIDTGTAAGCTIAFEWYQVGPLIYREKCDILVFLVRANIRYGCPQLFPTISKA